jgi:hypothetical protein
MHYSAFRQAEPLEYHIATLVDYCNDKDVRKASKSDSIFFDAFSCYIVSSCWRKMHQRITRWSAKGIIFCIARVEDNNVRVAYDECCSRGDVDMSYLSQRDLPLIKFVLGMGKDRVERVLRSYRFPGPLATSTPTLNQLISVFERIDKEQSTEAVYTQDTCVEFHHFLVAVLLSYSDALQQLKLSSKGDSDTIRVDAENVWLLGNLIWKISDSKVLEIHMKVISNSINQPSAASKKTYIEFVGGGTAEENEKVENDGEDNLSPPRMGLQCQQWIRLQASHFEGLHVLDSYCRGRNLPEPPTSIDISLIAVRAPPLEVEDWEETLTKLATLSLPNFDLDAATKFVRQRKAEKAKIYKTGKSHIGVSHCEAWMGVLMYVLKNGNLEQDDLTKLIQV